MNFPPTGFPSTDQEIVNALRQIYQSIDPQRQFTPSDQDYSQALLRGFEGRPSTAYRTFTVERTAEKIAQLSSERDSQTYLQLANSLKAQKGIKKYNQMLFVLSQLSNLGEKRKAKKPTPLSSVHSLSTSTPSITTPSSLSSRHTVMPYSAGLSTSQQRIQFLQQSQIPRPLCL